MTPTSRSTIPAASWYSGIDVSVASTAPTSGTSSASASSGATSRQSSRRRRGVARRTTPSGSITTPRSATSAVSTARAGTASAISTTSAGRRREVGGEHGDAPQLDPLDERAEHDEAQAAERDAGHGAREHLAGGDPPGHAAVGADEAHGREPPVARLAAESAPRRPRTRPRA